MECLTVETPYLISEVQNYSRTTKNTCNYNLLVIIFLERKIQSFDADSNPSYKQ